MIARDVTVARIDHLSGDYVRLVLDSPEQARLTRPGHFYMLGMPNPEYSCDPLLNRPISALDAGGEAGPGSLEFLVKGIGRGTRLLARLRPGDTILSHGPLGGTFPEPPPGTPLVLVGGGVGVAPLHFCAARWADRNRVALYYGGRDAAELPLTDALSRLPLERLVLSTEDGGQGYHGRVTAPLDDHRILEAAERVYCCGPNPMMRAVAERMAERPGRLWVSMENRMGCGMGACLGCVIPVHAATGETQRVRICVEGPVFPAEKVDWTAEY